jgi:hypothetical protein
MPREQLDMPDILKIVRKIQPKLLLEAYKSDKAECPQCHVARKVVKGVPVMLKSFCNDACLKDTVNDLIESEMGFIDEIAAEFAKQNDLPNGQTIHYLNDDYRNNNLLFWDAQNQRIVYPFTEGDDYGSVPPIFPVGDGYFNPTDWIDEVEHNSMVYPSITLIREMKEFVAENPGKKRMIVEINGEEYDVVYNDKAMQGQWDSCVLEVIPAVYSWGERHHKGNTILQVHRGEPAWRKDIVEEKDENIKAKNAALLGMVAKHAKGAESANVVQAEINRANKQGGSRTRRSAHRRRNKTAKF